MRLFFSDVGVFKRAAKTLGSEHALSARQNILARTCGYRDFHDLRQSLVSAEAVKTQRCGLTIDAWAELIIAIAHALQKDVGDTQYELALARFLPPDLMNTTKAISLRAAIYKMTTLPPRMTRQNGAVVVLRPEGYKESEPAFYIASNSHTNTTTLWTDYGSAPSLAADHEVIVPSTPSLPFIPQRLYQPYGYLTKRDGTKIVFSRDYFCLWKLEPTKAPERIPPMKVNLYDSVERKWFVQNDPSLSQNEIADLDILKEFRLVGLPQLVEVLELLIKKGLTIQEAVKEYIHDE